MCTWSKTRVMWHTLEQTSVHIMPVLSAVAMLIILLQHFAAPPVAGVPWTCTAILSLSQLNPGCKASVVQFPMPDSQSRPRRHQYTRVKIMHTDSLRQMLRADIHLSFAATVLALRTQCFVSMSDCSTTGLERTPF